MILETKRCILRPLKKRETLSPEMYLHFLSGEEAFCIEGRACGLGIGAIGLYRDEMRKNDKARSIGYALSPAFRGRGLMTECAREVLRWAFEERYYAVLTAVQRADNASSARVLEKCGFTREGVLRRAFLETDGRMRDDVLWSILPNEWARLRAADAERDETPLTR